ncbi:MAG: hypothetical protein ACR2PM_09465, partial [Hyphomicrobiales bacterium]
MRKRADARTWHDDLSNDVNQVYADARDWSGLEAFYERALSDVLSEARYNRVSIRDIKPFEDGVAACLAKAREFLSGDTDVKAVYFEYFYDGAEWCKGDLYLPKAYEREKQGWAAEWDHMIDGPNVHDYLNYDPEFEFERLSEYIAADYVHACFLAACGRAWDQAG